MEDRYLEDKREPPEELEAQSCKECGDELEFISGLVKGTHYWKCDNPFCPSKFEGVAREMALALIEYMDECYRLKKRIKYLENN